MSKEVFDVAILGGGPAGYVCAHAVYLEKGLLAVAGKACKMSDRFCNRAQQQLWLPRAFYAVPSQRRSYVWCGPIAKVCKDKKQDQLLTKLASL